MKTMLLLKSKGGERRGAVQHSKWEVGAAFVDGERGLKTRLLIPQEVCKRHARVTPNPSQHTDAFAPTHPPARTHTHTKTHRTHSHTHPTHANTSSTGLSPMSTGGRGEGGKQRE